MKIYYWNDLINMTCCSSFFSKGCGISIGSFDGLHKGHRLLLKSLKNASDKYSLLSGVFTFYRPLPSIKKNNDYLGDISTLNQRLKLFETLGMDFVIIAEFNDSFAKRTGIEFLELLREKCNLKLLAEGIDFKCGYKGATNIIQIKEYGIEKNIQTLFVDPVFYNDGNEVKRVSSSYIRQLIKQGKFSVVENLLERKFELDFENCSSLIINKSEITQVLPPIGSYKTQNNIEILICEKDIKLSETITYFSF